MLYFCEECVSKARFSFLLFVFLISIFLPYQANALSSGDRIHTTENLNVRNCTTLYSGECPVVDTMNAYSQGEIGLGPFSGTDNGYTWWLIIWDSGQVGYSVQDYLEVILDVNGIKSTYTTDTVPYQPDISISGNGFNNITEIEWTCKTPNGNACAGSPYIWKPSNWSGKFTVYDDYSAEVSPKFLIANDSGEYGTYDWFVVFYTSEQLFPYSFSVEYTPPSTPEPGEFTLTYEAPYCDTQDPIGPAVKLNWTVPADVDNYDIYRDGSRIFEGLSSFYQYFTNEIEIVAGQSYTYTIKAVNDSGTTSSNTVTVSIPSNICAMSAPSISGISPNPVPASSANQEITISGSEFRSGAKLIFTDTSGIEYKSISSKLERVSSSTITYGFNNDNDVGVWGVQVVNADGTESNTYSLNVTTTAPDTPTLTSVNPSTVSKGSSHTYVDLTGTNFTSSSYHQFSVDGGETWGWAKYPPNVTDSNELEVRVKNTTAQTVQIRVCLKKYSTQCSNSISVTISDSVECSASGVTQPLIAGSSVTDCLPKGEVQQYTFNAPKTGSYTVAFAANLGDPDLYIAAELSCIEKVPTIDECYTKVLKSGTGISEAVSLPTQAGETYYLAAYGSTLSYYSLSIGTGPHAVIDLNLSTPQTGDQVRFDGSKSIPGSASCPIQSYSWTFGDDTDGSGEVAYHTYSMTDKKIVLASLTIIDSCGAEDTALIALFLNTQANRCDGGQSCSADPVNLATGNYTYERTDLALPDIGVPFSFTRYYNSKDAHLRNGPLGYGWAHTYNMYIVRYEDAAVVVYGDGDRETYTLADNGTYMPQPGMYNTLTKNSEGTFRLTEKHGTTYIFNSQDKLSGIQDRNGNTLSIAYNSSDQIDTISGASGRTVTFEYNADGHIASFSDPIGRTITFSYSAAGDLVSATDAAGGITQYLYDDYHQIVTLIDPNGHIVADNIYDEDMRRVVSSQKDGLGNVTEFEYDLQNGITTVTDPLGNVTTHYHDEKKRITSIKDSFGNEQQFSYDQYDNRVRVIDKNGNETIYTYDEYGNVTSKTDALSNTTTITYNDQHDPVTRTDALGNTVYFDYDSDGNLLKTIDALGSTATTIYSTRGQALTHTDERGNTTTYTYDASGNVKTVTDALGNITTYTYDNAGRKLSKTNARGHTYTYTYDEIDNVLKVQDPLGNTVSTSYDGNSNTLSETDKNGNTTTYTYDAKDRLTTVQDALGEVATKTYDPLDRVLSVTDKNSNTTTNTYDAVGNLIKVTNALGHATTYGYDAAGNRISVTSPEGHTTTFTYDTLGRRTQVQDPLGNITITTHDALGRVLSVKDARGNTTSYEYDALGNLLAVTDAEGGTTTYTYDENGNRTSVTDPLSHTTTTTYDALNRPKTKTEPLGGVTQYGYDEVGNLTSLTKPDGTTITYSYDALDRLDSVTYPNESIVQHTYDAAGNRTSMTDSLGTQSFTYDALSRLTNHTDPFGNVVGYGYDAASNRTQLTYPDGKVVAYGYNELNQLTAVTDWLGNVTQYTYDTNGQLTGTKLPNGTETTYGYDEANRLTSLLNNDSDSTISSYKYTLDQVGNHITEDRIEPITPIFTPGTTSYSYDEENRLTAINGVANLFDDSGNQTSKMSDSFSYDDAGRLIHVDTQNTTVSYQYDGLGNRYSRTSDGVTTKYILDINTNLTNILAETDETGIITAYNIYGLGLISRINTNGDTFYYHYDSRGSTISLTDENGTVTDMYAYDPFGRLVNHIGETGNPFAFMGRHGITKEVGQLYYVRARFYNAEQQRFISKDAKPGDPRDPQSLNRFIYALNNPVILIDVSGYSAVEGNHSSNLMGPNDEWNWLLIEYVMYKIRAISTGKANKKIPPIAPSGIYINQNITVAESHSLKPFWFKSQVESGGQWDFKQYGSIYEDYGNFHYGVVGTASGFPEIVLLNEAGRAQVAAGTSLEEWGEPGPHQFPFLGTRTYGDDPIDQYWIKQGIDYYINRDQWYEPVQLGF